MDNKKEYILCAAIYYDDGLKHPHSCININTGFVVSGFRHCNIISLEPTNPVMFEEKHRTKLLSETQGFLTSQGRFVDRYEGMKIAFQAEQVNKEVALNKTSTQENPAICNQFYPLFSEDLY